MIVKSELIALTERFINVNPTPVLPEVQGVMLAWICIAFGYLIGRGLRHRQD